MRQPRSIAIGDGCRTKIWQHKWATSLPLLDLAKRDTSNMDQSYMVSDYWDVKRGWRRDLFADYLLVEVLKSLTSFELCLEQKMGDYFYLKASKSGHFAIKLALTLTR